MSPQVARQAVEWLVDLQSGSATNATRRGLNDWRQQHPDHDRAWRHIEAVNGRLESVSAASVLAHAALASPRSLRRRTGVKALAVLLFAGSGTWLVHREATPWQQWLADERTGVGERRTVRLADGSMVALNTGTALSVQMGSTERRLRLVSGEVAVTTGHEGAFAGLPFVVETAHGELRPLGTKFSVHLQDGSSRVAVYEGAVAIQPHDADGQALTLRAGEQTRLTRDSIRRPVAAQESDIAWMDGMLLAGGMRLADFLTELARHRPGRIDCDPAVAEQRVSGSYPLVDTDRILEVLQSTLPVRVLYFTRYWVRVIPRSTGA
ncbi:FecR family protein [Acidovorax sp. GBBC 1281]|uniref:FecR domain-containing protein n=1 Tax=Acidovorax sp. SUPP2522 TaxID=511900 RepID=UPI00234A82B5|nr:MULTISPECIES: FecR family protein [unclassified Acidovorax]WCN00464.1 FecR family protein [Acidovorax sp. GBBC 1281]